MRKLFRILLATVALLTACLPALAEDLPVYIINDTVAATKLKVAATFMGPSFEKDITVGAKGFLTNNGSRFITGASKDGSFAGGGNVILFYLGSKRGETIENISQIKSIDGQNCWVITIRGEL